MSAIGAYQPTTAIGAYQPIEPIIYLVNIDDSIGMSDAIISSIGIGLSDFVGMSDALLSTTEFSVLLLDSIGLSESLSYATEFNVLLSDAIGMSDSLSSSTTIGAASGGGFYGGLQTTTANLIEKFGALVTLKKIAQGTYDPSTGLDVGSSTDESPVKCVFVGAKSSWGRSSFTIEEGDSIALVAADGLAPEQNDLIDGWTIIGVETVQPASVAVLYKCHVRKQ